MKNYNLISVLFICFLASCTLKEAEVVTVSNLMTKQDTLDFKENAYILKASQKLVNYSSNNKGKDRIYPSYSDYLLTIELSSYKEGVKFPEGIHFRSLDYIDNGKLYDSIPNDGIYTSVKTTRIYEKRPDLSELNVWKDIFNRSQPDSWCVGCNQIDFVKAGEECLDEGTCEESSCFCVCGSDCYFCIGTDCDC